jgi:hypothetical protein
MQGFIAAYRFAVVRITIDINRRRSGSIGGHRSRLLLVLAASLALSLLTPGGLPTASAAASAQGIQRSAHATDEHMLFAGIGPIPDPRPSPDIPTYHAFHDLSSNSGDPQGNIQPAGGPSGGGSGGSWIPYALGGLVLLIGVGAWAGRKT